MDPNDASADDVAAPPPDAPTGDAAEKEPNRRRSRRMRTLLGGKIVLNEGMSVIDCRIRDMSETGAHLVVASSVGLPQRFGVEVVKDRRIFPARLVWRKADRVGVAFEGEATQS